MDIPFENLHSPIHPGAKRRSNGSGADFLHLIVGGETRALPLALPLTLALPLPLTLTLALPLTLALTLALTLSEWFIALVSLARRAWSPLGVGVGVGVGVGLAPNLRRAWCSASSRSQRSRHAWLGLG